MSVLSKALCLAVSISLISGCAARSTNTAANIFGDTDSADYAADTSATDAVDNTGEQQVASNDGETNSVSSHLVATENKQIVSKADAGLEMNVEKGAGFTRVVINPSSNLPDSEREFDVLSVNNPPRVVLDLIGETAITSSNYEVPANDFLKTVRLGRHQDRGRVVFDLTEYAADASKVDHLVEAEGGKIVVTFIDPTKVRADVAKEAVTPAAKTQLAKAENVEAEAPISEVSKPLPAIQDAGAPTLNSISFEKKSKDGGVVIAKLSEQVAFEMKKTAPSEYTLTLPGVDAAAATRLPQIAPAGTPGIRSVRAVQQDANTIVRMFIDSGVELTASPRDNAILIQSRPLLAANQPQARAQLAEGEAAKTTEEPAVTEPSDAAAQAEAIEAIDGTKTYTGRLISLDLQDTDIDNALRIIAEVSNLNIIASDDVTGKVTLRLIDVPWDQALDVILKTNGLDQVREGSVIRIAPVDKLRQEREALLEAERAKQQLEKLKVEYIRVSYARVSDLKELVEGVLTERGSVSTDDRTNQVIINDIVEGQGKAKELIGKLDLRTPQVLLETQIVEATRTILRDLGFQWNYSYIQSPQTGNATGLNFPNTVNVGGGTTDGVVGQMVNFPAVITDSAGSAITAVLDSADGSRGLTARLSALETEGKVKVISNPQVATVNNKQAEIKSVETIRVRLPDSGLSVATGQGASASGGGDSAVEEIEVGIELRVTPQASPDYYVLLDVEAKSSTFGSTVVDNIPSTLDREATSTILVKSGQTFALGGVYRVDDQDQIQGVPFLKDIPVLGALFRRTFVDKQDEELIFFITPHIVEGSFDESFTSSS